MTRLWSVSVLFGVAVAFGGERAAPVHTDLEVRRGYYENGALAYQRTYRAGKEDGEHRGWYDNGAVKFVYHYERGLSEGIQTQWMRSGQMLARFHHVHGQERGQQQMWNADGTIRSNYIIRDGRRYGLLGAVGCTGHDQADLEGR